MSTMSREFRSRIKGRVSRVFETPERGSVTLEQVIWYAVIGAAAVVVVGLLVAAIMSYAGQVPTG